MIKALVVDDEAIMRELFERMLTEQGYDVQVAMNEEQTLERLRAGRFDVILLDLILGQANGFDVLRKLKQTYVDPIILIVTGHGTVDMAVEAMKQGAVDFIMKPVTPSVLDIRIRKALDERRTQRLAITDGLTGLYNRRYFEERLEEETRRAKRYSRPVSIIMIDIDFFKQYNDTLGHLKGDEVLVQMGQILQRYSRETDITARYGGEEFVMILPETDGQNAGRLAERVRESVEQTTFEGETVLPFKCLTISLGVSSLRENETGREMLERADKALYKAKQAGKNQVCVEQKAETRNAAEATAVTSDEQSTVAREDV